MHSNMLKVGIKLEMLLLRLNNAIKEIEFFS